MINIRELNDIFDINVWKPEYENFELAPIIDRDEFGIAKNIVARINKARRFEITPFYYIARKISTELIKSIHLFEDIIIKQIPLWKVYFILDIFLHPDDITIYPQNPILTTNVICRSLDEYVVFVQSIWMQNSHECIPYLERINEDGLHPEIKEAYGRMRFLVKRYTRVPMKSARSGLASNNFTS